MTMMLAYVDATKEALLTVADSQPNVRSQQAHKHRQAWDRTGESPNDAQVVAGKPCPKPQGSSVFIKCQQHLPASLMPKCTAPSRSSESGTIGELARLCIHWFRADCRVGDQTNSM